MSESINSDLLFNVSNNENSENIIPLLDESFKDTVSLISKQVKNIDRITDTNGNGNGIIPNKYSGCYIPSGNGESAIFDSFINIDEALEDAKNK